MTKSDEKTLTSRQVKALPHLACCSSNEEACRQAGISKDCFYTWIKNPIFKAELEKLRNEIVHDAISHLKSNTIKAATTLVCLTDRVDSPSVQRAAANDILNQVMKFKELTEIEERLRALEKQSQGQKYER